MQIRPIAIFISILMVNYLCAADDVDTRIPLNKWVNENTFVLAISNENYKYEQSVPFAQNDGEVFAFYCEKTLGIPARNIKHLADASLNDMNHEIEWLTKVVKVHDGQASAIFYYSGHGMPDESSKEAFLLPIDGYSTDPGSGISTKQLYERLGNMNANRVYVFLDACFSGAKRDGSMMSASRGVAIKVKDEPVKGNLVVFSAAQGNETAYPYKSHQHGMFTYFLLDKLNKTGGMVTMGEMSDYVTKQVSKNSILENDKSQTPMVTAASDNNSWQGWTLVDKPAKEIINRTPTKHKGKSQHNEGTKIVDRSLISDQTSNVSNSQGALLNYTMPQYDIIGVGTGVQGTYLVKVTMTAKKPDKVSDADLTKCAVHGVLFRGFSGERQHQRPLAVSAANEQQHAGFYNEFFQQPYLSYAVIEPTSRMVMKSGKEYKVSALVSVKKDQLRKDLTQQGILKGLTNGF